MSNQYMLDDNGDNMAPINLLFNEIIIIKENYKNNYIYWHV